MTEIALYSDRMSIDRCEIPRDRGGERPKVLVMTSTFPRWPGDKEPPFVYELCRRLSEEFEILVLAPHAPGARRQEEMDGLEVYRYRYAPTAWEQLCYEGGILARLRHKPIRLLLVPGFLLAQTLAAIRLARRRHLALIHVHWLIPQGFCAWLGRIFLGGRRPPILCTSHGGDLFAFDGPGLRWLKARLLRQLDALTVVSSGLAEKAVELGAGKENLRVIPMGADLERRFTPTATAPRPHSLIFAGRLVEKKGLAYLLEAVSRLRPTYPDLELSVVGSGPLEAELRQLSDRLGIERQVRFLGAMTQESLAECFRRHQVAVFPFVVAANGDREGLPVVVSEAIGCGCALVTTDIPSIEDLVRPDVSALIVPQRNPRALAQAIAKLFEHPELRTRLATRARLEALTRTDWRSVADRYRQLLHSLCKE